MKIDLKIDQTIDQKKWPKNWPKYWPKNWPKNWHSCRTHSRFLRKIDQNIDKWDAFCNMINVNFLKKLTWKLTYTLLQFCLSNPLTITLSNCLSLASHLPSGLGFGEVQNRPRGNFCLAAPKWIYWPSGWGREALGNPSSTFGVSGSKGPNNSCEGPSRSPTWERDHLLERLAASLSEDSAGNIAKRRPLMRQELKLSFADV